MRRISALLAACLILLACVFPVFADNGDTIVYVTKTGECYHRADCSYLKSSIAISLAEAAENYRPCSRCNPPVLDTPQQSLPTRPSTWSTTVPSAGTTRSTPASPAPAGPPVVSASVESGSESVNWDFAGVVLIVGVAFVATLSAYYAGRSAGEKRGIEEQAAMIARLEKDASESEARVEALSQQVVNELDLIDTLNQQLSDKTRMLNDLRSRTRPSAQARQIEQLQFQARSFQNSAEAAQKSLSLLLSSSGSHPYISDTPAFQALLAASKNATPQFMRSFSSGLEIVPPLEVGASIRSGSGNTYVTTLTSCSCPDFQCRKHPCKHMIFLAAQLGLPPESNS